MYTCRDYVRRIELYELPCWTCKLTNQTNLTYFKALKSEEKARKGQPAMKRCFKKPILNVVHHSKGKEINSLYMYILIKFCFLFLSEVMIGLTISLMMRTSTCRLFLLKENWWRRNGKEGKCMNIGIN